MPKILIVTGRAPEYIRNDPDGQRIVRHFMGADQSVAQLCHAPQVLAAAGTLTGRRTAAPWRPLVGDGNDDV
jgi:protease I